MGKLSSLKPEGKPGNYSSQNTWANLGLHYQQSSWREFLRAVARMLGQKDTTEIWRSPQALQDFNDL